MNPTFAKSTIHSYEVHTSVYQGPLDLLLNLIESAELDITKLSLAKVTNQYLSHIQNLQEKEPDEVSAFMLIAAKLLQIKSEALLPHSSHTEEEEEDTGYELARQLLAYKRYKQIADLLAEREKKGLHTFIRYPSKDMNRRNVDFGDHSLSDLLHIARKAIQSATEKEAVNTVVSRPKVTVKEKIALLVSYLSEKGEVSFFQILGKRYSRLDVIVSFLAVLELIKRKMVIVSQTDLFGDIILSPSEKYAENRLEWGENEIEL
ncbi:MAG: segregation/condensation protein A [Anaerolineales bacterium]